MKQDQVKMEQKNQEYLLLMIGLEILTVLYKLQEHKAMLLGNIILKLILEQKILQSHFGVSHIKNNNKDL